MQPLVFLFVLMFAHSALAGVYAELNGLFSTDTFTTAKTAAYSKNFYALDIHSNLENKGRFYAGFHVDQLATTEEATAGTQAALSSLNMGPMGMWIMDHKKTFSVAAGYNVISNATYTLTGSASTTLVGSGVWASFGVTPEITENVYVGFRLYYFSLAYAKATTGAAASDVAYTRSMIFPTFSFAWRY